MRIAVYARVSTSDRDQDPETQLSPLREFVDAQGWKTHREYVDHAPANDQVQRTAWKDLLDDASNRRFDLLVVWKMDRAFMSVFDAATILQRLRAWGVGLRSFTEPWADTTSPLGEALIARDRKQGKKIGRPRVTDRPGFERRFGAILERLSAEEISRRQAARELGVGYATLKRLLDAPLEKA